MAENIKRTELSSLGEFALIDRLTKDFKAKNSNTIKAIGDDAAVIEHKDSCTLISTDMLVEGVHFDLSYMPLKHLGYKAVVVNISDIYAMNATPQQITVSVALSNRFSVEALEEFYAGIKQACETYHIDLVGGDTTSSVKGLIISITAIGSAKKEDITYRNGAKVGDKICVTGDLGGAYLGFQVLNREKQIHLQNPNIQPDLSNHQYIVGRQLKPEAKRSLIAFFKENEIKPTAMIDLSDGVSSDMMHIAKQSNVGCKIYDANLPVSKEVFDQAMEFNLDPMTCALNGGEDYEMLFTINPKDEAMIELSDLDISIIGEITKAEEDCVIVTSNNKEYKLLAQGWKEEN